MSYLLPCNLDSILFKPFLIHIKISIKDNTDFFVKCSRESKLDIILTTFDVADIEYWLDKFPETLNRILFKEFFLESLKFISEKTI